MEYIKIAKVDHVTLFKKGVSVSGTLHLTTHHLIFTLPPPPAGESPKGSRELWLCYPMIERMEFKLGSALLYSDAAAGTSIGNSVSQAEPDELQTFDTTHAAKRAAARMYDGANLRVRCRDFTFLAFDFADVRQCNDVFESVMKLTCLNTIDKVYAFIYTPLKIELPHDGWTIYDPVAEFKRQGVKNWRITQLNANYQLCDTYPAVLLVPRTVSDNVLHHAAKYRSKGRLPALTYYYAKNGCSITRCSQPLVGLKQARSVQDEKLVQEIFRTNGNATDKNLIADARPLTNAMAQTALGAGTENMDHYRAHCKKIFLGIDNIHVVRESLGKVSEALKDTDISRTPVTNKNKETMIKSNWLKLIGSILAGADILIKTIHLNNNHLVVHCSDGWDRTSQLTALVQLCIDPYFRTLDGFMVLVEKDWLAFGHRFNERCGFLQSETKFVNSSDLASSSSNQAQAYLSQVSNHFKQRKHFKYTAPVFHQFLDCIYQLSVQYPDRFQFNERFLRRLLYHLYSCQYGTFLYDSEHERRRNNLAARSKSVWDYFKARQHEFTNPAYDPALDADQDTAVLYPKIAQVQWWAQVLQVPATINDPSPTSYPEPVRPVRPDVADAGPGAAPDGAADAVPDAVPDAAADAAAGATDEASPSDAQQKLIQDLGKLQVGDLEYTEDAKKQLIQELMDSPEGARLDRAEIDEMIKEAAKELSI